jgi:hypothetical protein
MESFRHRCCGNEERKKDDYDQLVHDRWMAPAVRGFSPKLSWRNSTFERQPLHRHPHQKSNHHQRHPRFLASFSTALAMTGQTRISLYFSTVLVRWIETSWTTHPLLIAFSTAGDTHISFKKLGKALKLPQTAVLSLRAPEQYLSCLAPISSND